MKQSRAVLVWIVGGERAVRQSRELTEKLFFPFIISLLFLEYKRQDRRYVGYRIFLVIQPRTGFRKE